MDTDAIWILIGVLGQIIFFMRFLVQWLISERNKRSIVPVSFWYFSIVGGIILLFYAIHIKDIVFTLGYLIGLFIYIRNLYFIMGERNERVNSKTL